MPNGDAKDNLWKKLAEYGPKINTIYLELHNYKYYHTSSNIRRKDRRILGRYEIRHRLLQLFKNGTTKSGTYLITGSRGMGKTSLVNDVLRVWRDKKEFEWRNVGVVFALSVLFSTLYVSLSSFTDWMPFIGSIVFLLIGAESIPVIKSNWAKFASSTLFFQQEEPLPRVKTLTTLLVCLIIVLLSLVWDYHWVVIYGFPIYYFLFGCYYLIWRKEGPGNDLSAIERVRRRLRIVAKKIWDRGFRPAKKDILVVNLDVGQDDIDDVRILRQIVSRVGERCRRVKKEVHFIRNTFVRAIAFSVTLLITTLAYDVDIITKIGHSKVWVSYFPSQNFGLKLVNDADELSVSKIELIEKEKEGDSETTKHKKSSKTKLNETDAIIKTELTKDKPEPTESIGWLLDNVNNIIKSGTRIIDGVIIKTTSKLYKNFFRGPGNKTYRKPYYLMIFLFVSCYMTVRALIHFLLKKFASPYYINGIKRSDDLKTRMYAETSEVAAAGIPRNRFFNWSRRRMVTLPIASKYEIQMEVQKIIEELDSGWGWIPFLRVERQLVFVLDELDKIEPDKYYRDVNVEENVEKNQTRQQRITKTLQSLKSFFNYSRAKFIFIAGDDMYDASIADASNNREHSIDRLFNKVFYIPSFYSDDSDNRKSNINSMTESYVCQFLISNNHFKELIRNKSQASESGKYHEYDELKDESERLKYTNLENYYSLFFPENENSSKIVVTGSEYESPQEEVKIANLARVKTLYTLKNFITYLAYQSNGSPKKISSLFEQYITHPSNHGDDHSRFFVKNCEKEGMNGSLKPDCLFLRFTEEDQYKFGLINYLVTPFVISQRRYLGSFGDKLLVSTSFIVDHLYKYHDNAFSWKTLELTPEIISVSKAPQLRGFIKDIMFHFSRTHIDRIASGLFDFKFIGKVRNEIKFLSKVSDLEAAAFNFTLDESKETKIHYKSKLDALRVVYKGERNDHQNSQRFVHSLTFANMVLGDLEYYDQEYDNAILYYLDALQELRYLEKEKNENYVYNKMVFLRNSLKLGLAFEKQNNYDSALMTYERLKQEVLNLRNINTKDLGFVEFSLTFDKAPEYIMEQIEKVGATRLLSAFTYKASEDDHPDLWGKYENDFLRAELAVDNWDQWQQHVTNRVISKKYMILSLLFQRLFKKGQQITIIHDLNGHFFSFHGNHFFQTYFLDQKSDSKSILIDRKLFAFENLRLFYQPIIASLSLLEKDGINSIRSSNISSALQSFDFISRMINTNRPYMIEVEFLNKIGDLLYFKNGISKGLVLNSSKKFKSKADIAEILGLSIDSAERDYNMPIQGTMFYLLAIEAYWNGLKREEDQKNLYDGEEGEHGFYFQRLMEIEGSMCIENIEGAEVANDSTSKPSGAKKKKDTSKIDIESNILADGIEDSINNALEYILDGVASPKNPNPRSIELNTLANCYSDMGNAILSSVSLNKECWGIEKATEKIESLIGMVEDLNHILYPRRLKNDPKRSNNTVEELKDKLIVKFKSKAYSVESVVAFYMISSALYYKTYKMLKSAFQLQKIITLIDDYLFISKLMNEISVSKTDDTEEQTGKTDKVDYAEKAQELFQKIDELLVIPFNHQVNRAYQDATWQDMVGYKNLVGLTKESRATEAQESQQLIEAYVSRKNFQQKPGDGEEGELSFEEVQQKIRDRNWKDGDSIEPLIDFEFYKNSSIAAEHKEVHMLAEKIKIRLGLDETIEGEQEALYKSMSSHPYVDVSNQVNRIHELSLRGLKLEEFYRKKHKDALEPSPKKQGSDPKPLNPLSEEWLIERRKFTKAYVDENRSNLLELFLDAIFGYNEIISKLNVMEPGFQIPNIYFGISHRNLSLWLERLEWMPSDFQRDVHIYLEKLTNISDRDFLSKQYQWAKAKYHFVAALQTHIGMDPYTHTINHMYYLDDDFNDDQEHFYAAQERFHINSGLLRKLNAGFDQQLEYASRFFGKDFYSTDFVGNPDVPNQGDKQ